MGNKILILGGTADAKRLAEKLAARGEFDVMLSLAGRTANPAEQPVPIRIGGFGGAEGLAIHLRTEKIDFLIDATHPFAAQISRNAAAAAKAAGVPILAFRRPEWQPQAGDRWTLVSDAQEAMRALGEKPRRVFLAVGRQEVAPFEAAPQHVYLVRSVDPVEPPLGVSQATYLLARGPFREAEERALLTRHGIDVIVAKNSGGEATYGKIAAARALGIEVMLIKRPDLPDVPSADNIEALLAMIDHLPAPAEKRGV